MDRRRTATAVVALTASAGLIAGCGGSSSGGSKTAGNTSAAGAVGELTSAVSALGQASTLTASVKLGASGSQLLAFAHQQDPRAKLTATQANAIAGASLSFEVAAPSGQTLSKMTGLTNSGAANISVVDNGKTFIAIRFVNQAMYVQTDLKDLLNTLGEQQSYRQIAGAGAQLPAFANALVQGKWVSLPAATLKQLSGAVPGASAGSSANPGQARHFLDEIKSLLTTDVAVTKTSSGGTDTLTLTTNLRTLAADFKSTVADSIPGVGAALKSANLANVPNKNVKLLATVSGGALTGLSLDLGQFTKSGHGSLPLQLTFARSGPAITAPQGAVAVDLSQLGSLLGAFGAGGGL